ncbi:MAG: glycosyltransferase [Pirellulales bacterium]
MTGGRRQFARPEAPSSAPGVAAREAVGRRLRIALVSTSRVWGGAEEQLRLLVEGLSARGHDCLVLCKSRSPVEQRLEADGFATDRVMAARESKLSPLSWLRMRTAIRNYSPDILLLNDSASILCARFSGAWRLAGATVHVRHTCFPMRHPWLYDRVCRAIVCVTAETARICLEGGLPAEKLFVIHPGSDPARLNAGDRARGRASLSLAPEEPLLLTIAALVDCKGHETLLQTLPGLIAAHPTLRLALAGEGPLRPQLERLAKGLGIAAQVQFLGFRDDIPDLLQAADLCVIPSHLEGICSTLIEAMLAGRPLVTTLAGGMAEVAAPPGFPPMAWTVPPGDSAALAAALQTALDQPAERELRAARARDYALASFTPERTLDGFEQLFFSLAPTAVRLPRGGHVDVPRRAAG